MLHEGNEVQGKYGKQDWLIVRRIIAVAMGEPEKGKDPVDLYPGERVAQGRASPDHPAGKECLVQVKGGSTKINSHIFPDKFVRSEFEQLRWPEGRRARLHGCSGPASRWYACMDASGRVESGTETESTNSRRFRRQK
jgi:hypothetical protein